ncbi:concanavalin A lectin, partial [Flavobacterium sp. SE-s28]|nr:concanavalin A lectin [Flavobacterium silvaticum]
PVTLSVTVTNSIVPDFAAIPPFCSGSSVPALNTTSPNGITGSWSPATVSNTTSGNYVFTPDAGQCASPVTLSVTVTNSIVPDFAAIPPFCSGSSVPALNTTSPNGVTGSWS